MKLYLDTAYLAKNYISEPESDRIQAMVREASMRASSELVRAEFACTLHRHVRESRLSRPQADKMQALFHSHLRAGIWFLHPITPSLLAHAEERITQLPASVFLRSGDAIHLATAEFHGYREIWSNDRHLLAAAPHFGLTPRSLKYP
ncbi:MAG: type II toxin-antitoxin system VapC family toxin [Candidatus Solibacter usitatus]|nr:type II toxin-antitoxin system VapC family toxin [Candidatus Solibacter usitatus]